MQKNASRGVPQTPPSTVARTKASLRTRRKERTRASIHRNALTLAREKGVRVTTIEDIAAAAGISPRTFFNYYASKEDAVLGLHEPALTESMVAETTKYTDENLITRVALLFLGIMQESCEAGTAQELRELLREFPDLKHRFKIHHLSREKVLTEYLSTVDWEAFERNGRTGPFPLQEAALGTQNTERVRATVQLASAVLRQLQYTPIPSSEADTLALIQGTVATFNDLLKEN